MWLIIHTNNHKEKEVAEQLHKVTGYKGHFLPMYRRETLLRGYKTVMFVPLIHQVVFLEIDIPKYNESYNRARHIQGIFNNNGYLLYREKITMDGVERTVQIKTEARLMGMADTEKNIEERIREATISDSDIDSLRLFVDQMNSTMTEYTVVDDDYTLMESTQDTVMFTEGPYQGLQGIVKQKTVNRNRSRYFYVRLANWTFCIPNARTGRYVVLKEAAHGNKAREATAWTNADLMTGYIQSLSTAEGITDADRTMLADEAAYLLRLLMLRLGKEKSIEDLVSEAAEGKRHKEKTEDQLLMLLLTGKKDPRETISQDNKEARPTLKAELASALISLNRHYLSTANTIDYVLSTHIPDTTLRPFLTPTPGLEIKEKEDYARIQHADFTEYIIKVNLTPYLIYTRQKKSAPLATYYAHIGKKDGKCFVNWGDFSRKCEESKGQEFLADLRKKGLTKLADLLESDEYDTYRDDKNHIHGFSWPVPIGQDANEPSSFTSLVLPALKPLLAAAVEVWQSTRLLPLRNLLRRSVLLHRDPIIDQLVKINPDMDKILYDADGNPQQQQTELDKLKGYATKIDEAMRDSMKYNGVNYAVTIYHQLLASVNRYIETSLEQGQARTFTCLDNICTAAYNAIKSNTEALDQMQCKTKQEESKRKRLMRDLDKAMTQCAPTIEYIKKSPSYLKTGVPTCISLK